MESFYLNTLKLQLSLNTDIDNKEILPTNLVKNFLCSIFPKSFFSPIQNINIIPYLSKTSQEKLITFNLLSNDENFNFITKYINYLLKIKYNLSEIPPNLIKSRLQREKEKNIIFNLFYLTKFSEFLFNDIINNNLCANCYCKLNEHCENACVCHNMTEPEIDVENNLFKYEQFENTINNCNIEYNNNINDINNIENENDCDYTSNMKEDVEIFPKNKYNINCNNSKEKNNDCLYKINKVTIKKLNNLFISKGSNKSIKSSNNYSNNSEKKVYKFSLNKSNNSKEGKKIRDRYFSITNDFN